MRDSNGMEWLFLFILQIIMSPLFQIIIYRYIFTRFNETFGQLRLLQMLYFLPFVVAAIVFVISLKKYTEVNRSYQYLTLGQLTTICALTILAILLDCMAVAGIYPFINQQYAELSLPLFFMIKLTVTTLASHLLSVAILSRFLVKRVIFQFLIQIFGIFVYHYTVSNQTISESQNTNQYEIIKRFIIIVPKIQAYFNEDITIGRIMIYYLPHISIFISSIFNAFIVILTKAYLLKQGYLVKSQIYQKQKLKLKDGQLNISFLDKDMILKPRLIAKQSQVFKRCQYLYESKYNQYIDINDLYKPFEKEKPFPQIFDKIFITESKLDPISQAYGSYKKDFVLSTEEEIKFERLRLQRDKELGISKEKLQELPDHGYNLQSYLTKIQDNEFEYRKFRRVLKNERKKLKKLKWLDEMTNDYNYVMFHQHLFSEYNEFEAALLDQYFNSPGLDLIYQDYSSIIGLDYKHSFQLQSFIFLVIYPLLRIIDYISLPQQGDSITTDETAKDVQAIIQFIVNGDWRSVFLLLGVLAYSIIVCCRPIIYHLGITKFSVNQLLNMQIVMFYSFFLFNAILTNGTLKLPVMQVIGFTIVILSWKSIVHSVENDMKLRAVAQLISILKSSFEPNKRIEAQKIENQLCFIYDTLGEPIFRQAVQDSLLANSGKTFGYLAPSYLPQRKLFDPNYHKIKVDWGGGYPRPQVESIGSNWSVNTSRNPNQNIFLQMRPDINIADMAFAKQQNDLLKQRDMIIKLRQFDLQKRAIEYNHTMLRNALTKANQVSGNSKLLPQMTQQLPKQQQLPNNNDQVKLAQQIIQQKLKEQSIPLKHDGIRGILSDKMKSLLGQRSEQYRSVSNQDQETSKVATGVSKIISKVEQQNQNKALLLNKRKSLIKVVDEDEKQSKVLDKLSNTDLFSRQQIDLKLEKYKGTVIAGEQSESTAERKNSNIKSWIEQKTQQGIKQQIHFQTGSEMKE